MSKSAQKKSWLGAVSERAGATSARVEDVLAKHRIQPSPTAAAPRRLSLTEVRFAGNKDGVEMPGPFQFHWCELDHGLWAMVSESNLKGKSSVIEIIRWLLRGRPSDNLQEDVRRWVSEATVGFRLDQNEFVIKLANAANSTGTLVEIKAGGKKHLLASFENPTDFESVMADFFLKAFSLESVTVWRDGAEETSGKAVVHSWPAMSGVMFIGTDYSSLLGDLPPTSGLPIRLMQMYLGLPWISTLTAAKAVQKEMAREIDARERRRSATAATRKVRIDTIKSELDAKKLELAKTPSDREVRTKLAQLTKEYADAKKSERDLESRIDSIGRAVTQSETAHADDRRDYQAHLDAVAAGEIFRKLDPSCCPRCDTAVTEERRKQESVKKACSVCGGKIAADENAEALKDALKSRVDASKRALESAKREQKTVKESLDETQTTSKSLDRQITVFTKKLGAFDVRKRLETEVAVLEARLKEASHDPEPENANEDEKSIIDAIVVETDDRIKNTQNELLKDVSDQLTVYAQKFGMDLLSQAQLKGNMTLSIVKGGQPTSYSKVTEGEKLRLKVATVLAMIRVAEKKGVGRHPGLLMIDSPGAQEVAPEDREQLVAGLDDISKELAHLQVFVASIASADILKHIPKDRMRHAVGHDPLW